MILTKIKRIITCITSSLWFRIPIIFFIALVIIRIIFMFSPKNAAVNYESNDTRSINSLFTYSADCAFNTNSMVLKFDNAICIDFNSGIINGKYVGDKEFSGDAYRENLYIIPQYAYGSIQIKEINNEFFDFHAMSTNNKCSINAYKELGDRLNNTFEIATDRYLELQSENTYILSSNDSIYYKNELVEGDIIFFPSKLNLLFSLGSNSLNNERENLCSLLIPLDSLSGRAQFFNVSNTTVQGKGELNFTLPSAISTYDLNLIDLYLKSDDNNLVVTCDFSKDVEDYFKANVNGVVNDAKIANYDLFPTFEGWIANNIFLLPTAIISSVLIPILLDISKGLLKKKKDDEEEE